MWFSPSVFSPNFVPSLHLPNCTPTQLLEAQNSYDAAVAAKDNELATAMGNVDPLKAETQADIDELTDIISQLDIIREKFASIT